MTVPVPAYLLELVVHLPTFGILRGRGPSLVLQHALAICDSGSDNCHSPNHASICQNQDADVISRCWVVGEEVVHKLYRWLDFETPGHETLSCLLAGSVSEQPC